jgi:hypothetical protein
LGGPGILRRLIDEHEKSPPPGWDKLVERVKSVRQDGTELDMVMAVDAIINETPYIDNTGGVYFTPKRFFERGGAVCKDYVNVKYLLMRDAGFPIERMRVATLAPSAQGGYTEGHVVLLVKIEGKSEPYAMDLTPFHVFNQDLMANQETMAQRISRVKKEGLADHEPRLALANTTPLSKFGLTAFGSNRGFLAASNELGEKMFVAEKPAMNEENQLWMAADGSIKAFRAGGMVWVEGRAQQGFPIYKRVGVSQAERERQMVEKSKGLAPEKIARKDPSYQGGEG